MRIKKGIRSSVGVKLIALFISIVTIVVTLSSVLSFKKVFTHIENTTIDAKLNETDFYGEKLNAWLLPYKALLNETVKNIRKVDHRNTEEINEIFQTALEDNENILLYYVVNMDNSSVFSDGWEAGLDYDFASLAFFKQPLENKRFTYIEPEYDYVTEKLVIIMGTPVFDDNNEILGIAGVYINLDDVISAIDEINIDSDDKNFLFLVDESGNIIAHPNEDYLQVEDNRSSLKEMEGTGMRNFILI